jgi:hypothetical protein
MLPRCSTPRRSIRRKRRAGVSSRPSPKPTSLMRARASWNGSTAFWTAR